MIDVEGRKRIASNGIEVLEKFFLYGALEIRQSNFKKLFIKCLEYYEEEIEFEAKRLKRGCRISDINLSLVAALFLLLQFYKIHIM